MFSRSFFAIAAKNANSRRPGQLGSYIPPLRESEFCEPDRFSATFARLFLILLGQRDVRANHSLPGAVSLGCTPMKQQ